MKFSRLIIIFVLAAFCGIGFIVFSKTNTSTLESPIGIEEKANVKESIEENASTSNQSPSKLDEALKKHSEDFINLEYPEDPKWWHNANVYQIWVRSFKDTNDDGHGDLNGATEKLEYIASLGVDTIWLSPIFTSPSYHGYDVEDFYSIDPAYGTMEDFENLLKKADQAGIRVLLDLAINHVSEEHPWFLKALEKDSKYENYFVWKNEPPENYGVAWKGDINPTAVWHTKESREDYYYGVFGWTQPDLNFENPEVIEEIKDVLTFWLNKGVDGFRMDAIRYLLENDEGQADTESNVELWREFASHVKSINKDAFMVGEAHAETKVVARYFDEGNGLDQAFEFEFSPRLASLVKPLKLPKELMPTLGEIQAGMKDTVWSRLVDRNGSLDAPGYFFSSFINNHDDARINIHFPNDPVREKLAAAILLTSPGAVYVYYGEEIGMGQHARNDDVYQRAIMQWDDTPSAGFTNNDERWLDKGEYFFWMENYTSWWANYWESKENKQTENVAAQNGKAGSTLEFYRKLINIRKKDTTLSQPQYIQRFNNTEFAWVAKYYKDNEERLVIINLSGDTPTKFATPEDLKGQYTDLMSNNSIELQEEIELRPGQFLLLR